MRHLTRPATFGAALGALLLVSGEAYTCGGAFGYNTVVEPAQNIVVSYRDGTETYIFNPHFCGTANEFGLILPVPAQLNANPSEGNSVLYSELATLTAPTIETREVCGPEPPGSDGWRNGVGGSGGRGVAGGTTVVDAGQVGILDWALLEARTVESLTDWLDNNGYPYEAEAEEAFAAYVTNGWYFVAFKVSTSPTGTGGGNTGGASGTNTQTICGNLGPVSLSFPVRTDPVVPARIAAVSSTSLQWIVYMLADRQLRFQTIQGGLYFSGQLDQTDLDATQELRKLATPGMRLTVLTLYVNTPPNQDLILIPDPDQADYRTVQYRNVYVECGGSTGNPAAGGLAGTPAVAGSAGILMTAGSTGIVGAGGTSVSAGGAGGTRETPATGTGGVASGSTGGNVSTGGNISTGGNVSTGGAISTDGGIGTGGTIGTGGNLDISSNPTGGRAIGSSQPSADGGAFTGTSAPPAETASPASGGASSPAAVSAGHAGTMTNTPSEGEDDGGCGCRAGGPSQHPGASGLLVLAAALAEALRRRRLGAR